VSHCIGIDVSKSTLNVHIAKTGQDLTIDNTLKSIAKLHAKLKKIFKKESDQMVWVFEPTGSYSEGLRKYCSQKEIRCFIINPKQSANYAKALGEPIKNDKVDAQILARSITLAKVDQITVPYYDESVEQIKELMSFYKFTTRQTTQIKNHLESLVFKGGDSYAIKELRRSIRANKEKEKEIIARVQKIIDENPTLKEGFEHITTLPGIGQIGGIALLHLFMKYPEANQRQLTSLVGLNPVYRKSGSSLQSTHKISKSGSVFYRGSLFMGVMTAIRYDEYFKTFYARLKVNGKHTTQAQIAVMRKMILIAHSLYKNKRDYVRNFSNQEEIKMG
jgi:transposase